MVRGVSYGAPCLVIAHFGLQQTGVSGNVCADPTGGCKRGWRVAQYGSDRESATPAPAPPHGDLPTLPPDCSSLGVGATWSARTSGRRCR